MDGSPNEDDDHGSSFLDRAHAARDEIEQQARHARAQFDEANERIKERSGRDLIAAIAVGVIAAGAALASLLLATWLFALFAVVVACLGVHELWRAFRDGGRRVDLAPQLVGAVIIPLAGAFGDRWFHWTALFVAITLIVVWRLIAQMAAQDDRTWRDVLADVLAGSFIPLYVPFLASLALILLGEDDGTEWVLAFLAIAVAVDIAAYAVGRSLGRHRMAPRISPNKSWEGFAGAAVAALVVGALLAQFLLDIPWWSGLILGAVVLGTATLGDLSESMIKRDLGIKDMSSALPGHGGVLDRLDSILPSAAAALALHFFLTPLG